MDAAPAAPQPHLSRSARLRHVAFSPRTLWQLTRDSVVAWVDDFAPSMGAAISYYTAFSIAPLLLIVIALLGLFFGPEAATQRIFSELRDGLGPKAAATLQEMVVGASRSDKGVAATIVGVLAMIVGATTVFAELQSALDRIWRTPAAADDSGIIRLVVSRFLSFGMIVAVGFLLLISLLVSSALAALGEWWAPLFGGWELVLNAVNFVVGAIVVTLLFALIYKILPRSKIGWEDVWIGAAFTALLFSIGKLLIGLYVGKSGVVTSFGAAGSILVVLIWVYYSAQIFLLGAEFTWHYAYRFGSRRHEAPPQIAAAKSTIAQAHAASAPAAIAPRADPKAAVAAPATGTAHPPVAKAAAWNRTAPVLAGGIVGGWLAGHLVRRFAPLRRLRSKFGH
jgi:membrane protein